MFDIEGKIKSWFKNNVWNPIVSGVEKITQKDKEKPEGLEILTDEELTELAKKEFIDDYNFKKGELDKTLLKETEKSNDKATKSVKTQESKIADINDYYDNQTKKTVTDSVNQGISRSSIVDGQIDKLKTEKQAEIKSVEDNLKSIIEDNNKQIGEYTEKYDSNLKDLNEKFNANVNEKFKQLKAEQDKKIQEYYASLGDLEDLKQKEKEAEYQKLLNKYKNIKLDDINVEELKSLPEEEVGS